MNTQALLFAATLILSATPPVSAVPYEPSTDAEIVERLPTSINLAMRALRSLRERLKADPHNLVLALKLARRYLALGRAESDPRYYGYAQGVLQPWWHDPPPAVRLLRASLLQNRHEFAAALADLRKLLEQDPYNAQAWLIQAVVQQVRGEYAAARRSCLRLLRLANRLSAAVCLFSVDGLDGRTAQSYARLNQTLQNTQSDDPELRIWGLTVLAELAVRLEKVEAAERHLRQALAMNSRDAYLLAAYADFLLERDRPEAVVKLLDDHTRVDGLLLRLALAEQRLGMPEFDTHRASLSARFEASRLRGESLHQAEEARFRLQILRKPAAALNLAQANWAVQREPRDARVLLEAAIAARDRAAAAPVLALLRTAWREDLPLNRLAAQLNQE